MTSAKRSKDKLEWNASDSDNEIHVRMKRRVNAVLKRGSKGYQNKTKPRIISAAEKGAGWRAVASANRIPIPTAYGPKDVGVIGDQNSPKKILNNCCFT